MQIQSYSLAPITVKIEKPSKLTTKIKIKKQKNLSRETLKLEEFNFEYETEVSVVHLKWVIEQANEQQKQILKTKLLELF